MMNVVNMNMGAARHTFRKPTVFFGNDQLPERSAQNEFLSRLKGIETSLKDGSFKMKEVSFPEGDEYFIRGVLEKSDGQTYTFTARSMMSSKVFILENEGLGIRYDCSVNCGRVSVNAFDRRAGKAFSYQVQKADSDSTPMNLVAEQIWESACALSEAAKRFRDNPPNLGDIPTNRDF